MQIQVTAFIEAEDGFTKARQAAERIVAEAVAALDTCEATGDRKSLEVLRTLAGYVLARNR